MIRILLLLCGAGLIYVTSFSQRVEGATLIIDKEKKAGQTVTLPENESLVKDFIAFMIEATKGKAGKSRGLITAKNVEVKEYNISSGTQMYFETNETKSGGKKITVVTLALKDKKGVFASDTDNAELYQNAGIWLNTFPLKLEIYKRDREIEELKQQLAMLNKKLKSIQSDVRADKKDNLRDIKDNEKAIEDIQTKLDALQKSTGD